VSLSPTSVGSTASIGAVSDARSRTWSLHRKPDGALIAELVVTKGDFPWLYGQVRPYDGFADVVPLFTEELRLLDGIDQDTAAWEAAYDAIRAAVTLRYPTAGRSRSSSCTLPATRPGGAGATSRSTRNGSRTFAPTRFTPG